MSEGVGLGEGEQRVKAKLHILCKLVHMYTVGHSYKL